MSDRGHAAATGTVFLPMSRYDIADYLAMAVETVSRTLTELRTGRMIVLRDVRHVSICDRGALEHLTSGLTDVQRQPAQTREKRTHEDLQHHAGRVLLMGARSGADRAPRFSA